MKQLGMKLTGVWLHHPRCALGVVDGMSLLSVLGAGASIRLSEGLSLAVPSKGANPTVTKARMRNLSTGGNTVLGSSDIAYGVGFPEEDLQ